jgi:DNA-binding cell septation regulator SpoVG
MTDQCATPEGRAKWLAMQRATIQCAEYRQMPDRRTNDTERQDVVRQMAAPRKSKMQRAETWSAGR